MKEGQMETLADQFSSTVDYRTLKRYVSGAAKSAKMRRKARAAFLRLKRKIGFILADFRFSPQKMQFYRILRRAMPDFAKAMSLF